MRHVQLLWLTIMLLLMAACESTPGTAPASPGLSTRIPSAPATGVRSPMPRPRATSMVVSGTPRAALTASPGLLSPTELTAIPSRVPPAAAFSPDGSRLVTIADTEIVLWDATTFKSIVQVAARSPLPNGTPGLPIVYVRWRADGEEFYTISPDATIISTWSKSGEHLRDLRLAGGERTPVSVSPDGKLIALVGTNNHDIELRDMQGQQVASWQLQAQNNTQHIRSVTWSGDSANLAIGHVHGAGVEGTVEIWTTKGTFVLSLATQDYQAGLRDVAWSPDDSLLAVATSAGVQVWSAKGEQQALFEQAPLSALTAVAWSADSRSLLLGGLDGSLTIVKQDAQSPQVIKPAEHASSGINMVAWSPDGTNVLWASTTIHAGTIQTVTPLTPIPPEVGYPYAPIVEQSATPDGFEPTPRPTVTPTAVPDSTATAAPDAAAVTLTAVPDSTATAAPDAVEVTPPASGESLLRKRNSPPPDMPGSIPLAYGSALFACQAVPDANLGLRLTIYEPEYEIGQGFAICITGSALEQPIELQIKDPQGTVVRHTLDVVQAYAGVRQFNWAPRPGDPLGVYQITATQGEQHFITSVRIRAATQPHLLVMFSANDKYLYKSPGRPGDTVWIVLAGFQPYQQVPLHLYEYVPRTGSPSTWEYVAYIASVEMDADGQAVYELATRLDDPTGTYGIRTQPPVRELIQREDEFSLR